MSQTTIAALIIHDRLAGGFFPDLTQKILAFFNSNVRIEFGARESVGRLNSGSEQIIFFLFQCPFSLALGVLAL